MSTIPSSSTSTPYDQADTLWYRINNAPADVRQEHLSAFQAYTVAKMDHELTPAIIERLESAIAASQAWLDSHSMQLVPPRTTGLWDDVEGAA